MRVLGLMSGTSADAVDAALVEWPAGERARPFRLLAFAETPLPQALQRRIHALAAGRVRATEALAEVAALDVLLGELFADAALALCERAGVAPAEVDALASHGQTVAHHPELGASLQLGDPARLAERTGCTVVADFRARDLAAGGEGAPLAPFFHHAALAAADEARLVLNLGGIANLTWLPAGCAPADVVAFDVGPANALLDGVVACATRGAAAFDADGARAAAGQVDAALLAELLDDAYLRRAPPKSTGRERYGLLQAEALWQRVAGESAQDEPRVGKALHAREAAGGDATQAAGNAAAREVAGAAAAREAAGSDVAHAATGGDVAREATDAAAAREVTGAVAAREILRADDARALSDLLATLVAACAESVARAAREHLQVGASRAARLLLCGGGARNPVLVRELAARTGLVTEPVDAHGIPAAAVEAMAFSLMGRNALLGLPNHLPRTTGARRACVLGELTPGATGRCWR